MIAASSLRKRGRVLTIKLAPSPRSTEATPGGCAVNARLTSGGDPVAQLRFDSADLGLPLTYAEALDRQSDDGGYRIPSNLEAMLRELVPEGDPLWLCLESPAGYLPVLPWERLLYPIVPAPVLRVPIFDLEPLRPRDSLDVALCLSFPVSKDDGVPPEHLLDSFYSQIPPDLAANCRFHVFGDLEIHGLLLNWKRRIEAEFAGRYRVKVYDPAKASEFPVPPRDADLETGARGIENPWLLWMRAALLHESVDFVHFICHGYLGDESGALALAESPMRNEDELWARFVGVRELSQFLELAGAWSVAFTSPPRNFSRAGLRMLADKLARVRPGPVLLHDMTHPDAASDLDSAYRFVYGVSTTPPRSACITISCSIAALQNPSEQAPSLIPEQFSLRGASRSALEANQAPPWMAAAQRILERSYSSIPDPTEYLTPPDPAAEPGWELTPVDPLEAPAEEEAANRHEARRRGAETAARFAADVLSEHLEKWAVDNPFPEANADPFGEKENA